MMCGLVMKYRNSGTPMMVITQNSPSATMPVQNQKDCSEWSKKVISKAIIQLVADGHKLAMTREGSGFLIYLAVN